MKVGIAGFPGSGKTTIFNALSGQHADVGGFTEPGKVHLGAIKVPDVRVARLSEIFKPRKTTYAEIVFVDFPASQRTEKAAAAKALDGTTLVQMRESDALVHVVRAFPDPVSGEAPQPLADIENFNGELLLADQVIIEKRLERLRKEKGHDAERLLLERCKTVLEEERPLRRMDWLPEEGVLLAGFGFLSRRPLMVVLNVPEENAASPMPEDVAALLEREQVRGLVLSGKIEMEIAALDVEDRGAFLQELGLAGTARERFIRAAYELLTQISFLTTGEDEVRAWTLRRGTTAVKAAGKIHSDIERGFIRAEVVHYDDFIALGSEAKAREAGKLRLEGKEYVVNDGDMIHFRFNV
jgi:GTP-binding protein YchF